MEPSSPLIIELAAHLRQQRQLLAAQLHQRLHGGADDQELGLANFFTAQDDAAEASQRSDIDVAQLDHESAELQGIDQALQRITDGSYGACASCGDAIAEERLKAQPAACLCLACQKAAEQRLPQR
ncbi:MAG: TraR/DksA family transcriptional regulator [Sphingomonadaceae bacterium]